MNFSKTNEQIDTVLKPTSPIQHNWNPYLKKAERGGSVELTSRRSQNRSAPFKPLLSRAVSIKKSRPASIVQTKQLEKTKQIKEAIQARKAIYASMFRKVEEGQSESEYDSEYWPTDQ